MNPRRLFRQLVAHVRSRNHLLLEMVLIYAELTLCLLVMQLEYRLRLVSHNSLEGYRWSRRNCQTLHCR